MGGGTANQITSRVTILGYIMIGPIFELSKRGLSGEWVEICISVGDPGIRS